jgi:hypothetical protein
MRIAGIGVSTILVGLVGCSQAPDTAQEKSGKVAEAAHEASVAANNAEAAAHRPRRPQLKLPLLRPRRQTKPPAMRQPPRGEQARKAGDAAAEAGKKTQKLQQ